MSHACPVCKVTYFEPGECDWCGAARVAFSTTLPTIPIPKSVDILALVGQLNLMGWRDYKIETALGLTGGYISQLRCGNVKRSGYEYTALILNFYVEQRLRFHMKPCAQDTPIPQLQK